VVIVNTTLVASMRAPILALTAIKGTRHDGAIDRSMVVFRVAVSAYMHLVSGTIPTVQFAHFSVCAKIPVKVINE
jgi:hypothetical protein